MVASGPLLAPSVRHVYSAPVCPGNHFEAPSVRHVYSAPVSPKPFPSAVGATCVWRWSCPGPLPAPAARHGYSAPIRLPTAFQRQRRVTFIANRVPIDSQRRRCGLTAPAFHTRNAIRPTGGMPLRWSLNGVWMRRCYKHPAPLEQITAVAPGPLPAPSVRHVYSAPIRLPTASQRQRRVMFIANRVPIDSRHRRCDTPVSPTTGQLIRDSQPIRMSYRPPPPLV